MGGDKRKVSELLMEINILLGVSAAVDFATRVVTVWITKSGDSTIVMNSLVIKALQQLGYVINIVFH